MLPLLKTAPGDFIATKPGDEYSDEELKATPIYQSMTRYLAVDHQNALAVYTLVRQAITQKWMAKMEAAMAPVPLAQTPHYLSFEVEIPVQVTMKGVAKVKLPLHHTSDDVDAALENIDPLKLKNLEADDGEDWWRPEVSKHHDSLGLIGKAFRLLMQKGFAVIASEYDNSGSQGEADEMKEREPTLVGYAYIHGQAIEQFLKTGTGYVGFGAFHRANVESDVEPSLTTIQAGEVVAQTLRLVGLNVEWSPNGDRKIQVRSLRNRQVSNEADI